MTRKVSHKSQFLEQPFPKRFAVWYRKVVCPVCLSVCNVGVLWPNGWMDQDEAWHGGRPWPRPRCFRVTQKGGTAVQFSAHVYCGQTVAHLSYC